MGTLLRSVPPRRRRRRGTSHCCARTQKRRPKSLSSSRDWAGCCFSNLCKFPVSGKANHLPKDPPTGIGGAASVLHTAPEQWTGIRHHRFVTITSLPQINGKDEEVIEQNRGTDADEGGEIKVQEALTCGCDIDIRPPSLLQTRIHRIPARRTITHTGAGRTARTTGRRYNYLRHGAGDHHHTKQSFVGPGRAMTDEKEGRK